MRQARQEKGKAINRPPQQERSSKEDDELTQETSDKSKFRSMLLNIVLIALGVTILFVMIGLNINSRVVVVDGDLVGLKTAADDWCKSRWTDYPYDNGQLTVGKEGQLQIKCSNASGSAAIWSNLKDEAQ